MGHQKIPASPPSEGPQSDRKPEISTGHHTIHGISLCRWQTVLLGQITGLSSAVNKVD
jgi:hypothetical protein